MLYSNFIIAASVFAGFASAQNSSFSTPCCSVPANTVPQSLRSDWCTANSNTCVELCGGQGDIASNGNVCSDSDLKFTCKCSNGTDISSSLTQYQQSVPGLMCRWWYDACVNATVGDGAAQFQCLNSLNSQCGNKTTSKSAATSSAAATTGPAASASPTTSSGSTQSHAAAANLGLYATPVLAGGLLALFGLAL